MVFGAINALVDEVCSARPVHPLSAEETARMQRETESLYCEIKLIEESHGENVLNLVPAIGYIRKLLANGRVARYLQTRHADIHTEISTMVREPDRTGP